MFGRRIDVYRSRVSHKRAPAPMYRGAFTVHLLGVRRTGWPVLVVRVWRAQ